MKILIIRSGPYQVNPDAYNLQELGLASAFMNVGHTCDIMYYHKKESYDQVISKCGHDIKLLWRKGIRFLRSGVYPEVLHHDFLRRYDVVIISEYSQIMSFLVASRHSNAYIYNGPYYNLFKIKLIEPIYDFIFCKRLNSRAKKIFCKTRMSADYLIKKGLTNVAVVGVGLDTEKFDSEKESNEETKKLLDKMKGKRNLLYVGSIIPRKNTELLIRSFIELKKERDYEDVQLVLVGKGDLAYEKKCKKLIPKEIENDIVWCDFIKNAQLKFIYQEAFVFLLPSVQEIFGMVLLEAMYFGLPVVSSLSAGADTLIKDGCNGFLIDSFDVMEWKKKIQILLDHDEIRKKMSALAEKTIKDEFMWSSIARKILGYMEE